MKKKLIIAISSMLFAAVVVLNINVKTENEMFDVSVSDLTIMAKADGESLPDYCEDMTPYTCYSYANKKDCMYETEIVNPPSNCAD